MDPIRLIARASLGTVFVLGGIDALRAPKDKAQAAAPVTSAISSSVSFLPNDDVQLVRINAGVHITAGGLLALGKLPRASALLLAGSLVPTTIGGHRFWEATDPDVKAQQLTQATKNLAMFGGMLFAALDRGGKPSLGWRARHLSTKLPTPG